MAGFQKVTVLGYLGKDPETRFVPDGTQVTKFSVAVSDSWKDKSTGEKVERTEWFNCEAWGKLAEICGKYLVRGQQVFCEGTQRTEEWTTDQGEKRRATKVRINVMKMVGENKSGNTGNTTQPANTQKQAEPQQDFDDDIPFAFLLGALPAGGLAFEVMSALQTVL